MISKLQTDPGEKRLVTSVVGNQRRISPPRISGGTARGEVPQTIAIDPGDANEAGVTSFSVRFYS